MARYIIRLQKDVDIDAFAADVPNVVKVLRRVRMVVAELDEAQAEALRGDARVEFVEADQPLNLAGTQAITNEWQLDRIDQRNLPLDNSYTWEYDGAGVTIYLLDTGIRDTHEAFAGRIGPGHSVVDDEPYTDSNGHGTWVAGAAAGLTTGPARGATISSVKITTGFGGTSNIPAALDWVLNNHNFAYPAVVSISLTTVTRSSAIDAACHDCIEAGIQVFAAAGNDDQDASNASPAGGAYVVAVSATDASDAFHDGYNYGASVDLLAPGRDIWVPTRDGTDTYTTVNGTSFSAPLAAGVAATMLEADPTLTPWQLRALLLNQATEDIVTGVPAGTPNRLLYSDIDVTQLPTVTNDGVQATVGAFRKRPGTGTQAIEGIGFTPKALLFFLVAPPIATPVDEAVYNDNRTYIGFATSTAAYTATTYMDSELYTQAGVYRGAFNGFTVQHTNSVLLQATVASWGANGFTLDWTANNDSAHQINYLALGGDDLEVALLAWQKDGSGNQAITGAGFQPDCVIHNWTRYDDSLSSLPGSTSIWAFGNTSLGVMLADGTQWVMGAHYNTGSSPTNNRSVRNDACIVYQNSGIGADNLVGSFVSMDPDGFTVSYDTTSYNDTWCFSLCLKGGKYAAGLLTQPDATGSQEIATPDVLPRAVLLNTTMQPSTDVNDGSKADAYWGMGASDGTTSRFVGLNAPHEDSQQRRQNYSSEAAALVYNSPEFDPIDAVAQMDSLGNGSFTLDWTATDDTGAQIGYLAIGTEAGDPPSTPTGLTATAIDYDKVLLTWDAVDDGDGDGS